MKKKLKRKYRPHSKRELGRCVVPVVGRIYGVPYGRARCPVPFISTLLKGLGTRVRARPSVLACH